VEGKLNKAEELYNWLHKNTKDVSTADKNFKLYDTIFFFGAQLGFFHKNKANLANAEEL
jgi:hypothetical protein